MKGIIYVMTTAVSGLVKIGQTGTGNYQERMRNLEANGYYNVAGLKRFFAIELEDYTEKEALLRDIFNKHQVGESELFALDQELRNAIYTGPWLTDAKRYFSKTGCAAYGMASDYLEGAAIRQEYLESNPNPKLQDRKLNFFTIDCLPQ